MIIALPPLLALAFLSGPAIITPSHFALAGTITPIGSTQQCNQLLMELGWQMPRQKDTKKNIKTRETALHRAGSVMARLCREKKFGQAARQYQALKGALKAYHGQP